VTSIFQFPADSFAKRVLLLSLLLHLCAAFFSTGYHHYDEHYQILEWAAFKLGLTPVDRLAWEYAAQARSWFQPAIAFALSRGLEVVGLFNPFWVAFFLRLTSALLGWWVTVGLVRCTEFWFPELKIRRAAVLGVGLAWFVPYLHARFSSENWAGTLFLLGMLPLIHWVSQQGTQTDTSRARGVGLVSGLLWAASFQCRFHAGLLILPAVVWLVVYAKAWRKLVAGGIVGFLLVTTLGVALDRWGYGEWVFSAANYFRINVLEGKASEWGVAPFWFYFERFLTLAPPLSTVLVIGTLACWGLARRFSLTWITLFFVLAHSLVPHKELRFLFPILPLTPLLTCMAVQKSSLLTQWFIANRFRLSAGAIWFCNFLFLLPLVFLPTRTELRALKILWNQNPDVVYVSGINPFSVPGVEGFFYRRPALKVVNATEADLKKTGHFMCLYPLACGEIQARTECEYIGGSLPKWTDTQIPEKWRARAKMLDWRLFQCS
jgi:phosphatidylinositol glycan class B